MRSYEELEADYFKLLNDFAELMEQHSELLSLYTAANLPEPLKAKAYIPHSTQQSLQSESHQKPKQVNSDKS